MNDFVLILGIVITIFIFGNFMYVIYGDKIREKFGFPRLSETTLNANINIPTSENLGVRTTGFRNTPQ